MACFNNIAGSLVDLTNGNRTASRRDASQAFDKGVVFSNEPLRNNQLFEVRLSKKVNSWSGSIEIGVTSHDPATLNIPTSATGLKTKTYIMSGASIVKDGVTYLEEYGQDLDQLVEGDRVGVMRNDRGALHFYVNGKDHGPAVTEMPDSLVWAVVDMYGKCAQVTIVDSITETSQLLDPSDVGNPPFVGGETVMMSGCGILTNGKGTRREYERNSNSHIHENITHHMSQTEDRAPTPNVYDILRFHPRHGRNAIVKADGRTASRINSCGELNDAIVITSRPLQDNELFEVSLDVKVDSVSGSIEAGVTLIPPDELDMPSTMTDLKNDTWMLSGSAVIKDGSKIRTGYNVDLDALSAGTRVGMLRASDAALHFFVNGEDMGVACSGVPSDVYAVMNLYGQCAQVSITQRSGVQEPTMTPEIDLSLTSAMRPAVPLTHRFSSCAGKHMHVKAGTCDIATRVRGFDHGLLFSMEPLSPLEIFEVRIERVNCQLSGSLRVGLTSLAVSDGLALSLLPASALELRTSPSWILAGSRVVSGGQTVTDNYGPSLSRLNVGDRVGVMYKNSGEMHVFINGQDLGSAASSIPEGVFAVVDVFGATEQVSITSTVVSPHVDWPPASGPPSIHTLDSFTGAEQEEIEDSGESDQHSFHTVHGCNVTLLAENRAATRHASYNKAIVLSERPLVIGELFQVRVEKIVESWSSGLGVGVVACSPERLVLAPRAISLQQPTWVVHGRTVYHAGKKVRDGYGVDLDTLVKSSLVGVRLDETGSLYIHIDGTDQGVAVSGLPTKGCHVILDLYGRCEKIIIQVPQASSSQDCQKEKADYEQYVKTKISSSGSASSAGSRRCKYKELCARFKNSLVLPDGFFNASQNRCFCITCENSGGNYPHNHNGEPPKDFAIPAGWCEFPLKQCGKAESQQKLEKWHVAFHGAHVSSIRRSLDTQALIPAGEEALRTLQPQLFTQDDKNRPDVDTINRNMQLYFSPSISNAGLPKFSPVEWRDPQTQSVWQAQVAWQLCVKPGSYQRAHDEATELVLQEERIDSRFANSEIVWHTKDKGAITMVALLIKIV